MAKISERQKRYRELRKSGYSRKAAAVGAGFSERSAMSKKWVVALDKQVGLADELELGGLTNRFFVEEVKSGLKADSAVVVSKSWYDDNGNKCIDQTIKMVPNYQVRAVYLKMVLEIMGKASPPSQAKESTGPTNIQINLIRSDVGNRNVPSFSIPRAQVDTIEVKNG